MVSHSICPTNDHAIGGVTLKVLEISSLGYAYDDGTRALKAVELTMEDGEKVAVIGPNGAGKSTLIHLVAGFRMPFEGVVRVRGEKLNENSADSVRRLLGMLFQDPDDQIFMPTVEEDVAFGPMNLGQDNVEERVTRGLRSVGIEELRRRRPHRLSHGMKKRVAIAGVLAMDPAVLLLDEPTAGLDPESRASLIELLGGMKKTMLLATHDLEAAAEIADRVVLLNGEVLFNGTMAELVGRRELLERSGMRLPQLQQLFQRLIDMGYDIPTVPTSLDHAVAEAARALDRGKGGSR